MIFVYFDKNGKIKEIINDEKTRVGNNQSDRIFFHFEEDINDEITCVFKNVDGTLSNEISIFDNVEELEVPYDKKRDLKYFKDYKKYKFYVYDFPDVELHESGLAKVTVRSFIEGRIYAQGLLTFNVQENIIKTDHNISQSQFDYLLIEFSEKANSMNERMQELKEQLTWNRVGLLKISEYDEDAGIIEFVYNPDIVDDLSYDEDTGELTIEY